MNETPFKLQFYLPHHPVISSHKPENVRRVSNAADRSTNLVKTFEAEPQSSSIFELNLYVETNSLIVFRGSAQQVPAKVNKRIVLSFV